MSYEGAQVGQKILRENGSAADAVEKTIREVEANPLYRSVGYGGLPDCDGTVSLDSGYMDGNTLSIGAIGSIRDFLHPISIARQLSEQPLNNCLFGTEAEKWASIHGFERKNLHEEASMKLYKEACDNKAEKKPSVYKGHDTVCVIALDSMNHIVVGTSTSGLFMKTPGRVGDSPFPGCGFYADERIGAAAATGVGEEIMKGCLSYQIVSLICDGHSPQAACDKAVHDLESRMIEVKGSANDISVIAMDRFGHIGVSTTIQNFSFVTSDENDDLTVYVAAHGLPNTTYTPATEEWLKDYMRVREEGKLEKW